MSGGVHVVSYRSLHFVAGLIYVELLLQSYFVYPCREMANKSYVQDCLDYLKLNKKQRSALFDKEVRFGTGAGSSSKLALLDCWLHVFGYLCESLCFLYLRVAVQALERNFHWQGFP